MSDQQSPDPAPNFDELDFDSEVNRAKPAIVLGVLAFFPGIALAFIYVLVWAAAFATALLGLYLGIKAIRGTTRPGRPWIAAVIGIGICAGDVLVLGGLFVWSLAMTKH